MYIILRSSGHPMVHGGRGGADGHGGVLGAHTRPLHETSHRGADQAPKSPTANREASGGRRPGAETILLQHPLETQHDAQLGARRREHPGRGQELAITAF